MKVTKVIEKLVPCGIPGCTCHIRQPSDPVSFKLEKMESCGHPGCRHHVSHPCEGCGRIGGSGSFFPGRNDDKLIKDLKEEMAFADFSREKVAIQALQAGLEVVSWNVGSMIDACKTLGEALVNMGKYIKIFWQEWTSFKWWEKIYIWCCWKLGLQLKAQRYILKKIDREIPGPESRD